MSYCKKCQKGFDRPHDEDGPGRCPRCYPVATKSKVAIAIFYGLCVAGIIGYFVLLSHIGTN